MKRILEHKTNRLIFLYVAFAGLIIAIAMHNAFTFLFGEGNLFSLVSFLFALMLLLLLVLFIVLVSLQVIIENIVKR